MKLDEMFLKNKEAFLNPKPGDYWHERFSPYFIVVLVNELWVVVLDKKIQADPNYFEFIEDDPSVYSRLDFEKQIKYSSAVGKEMSGDKPVFCADVINGSQARNLNSIVKDFNKEFPTGFEDPIIKALIVKRINQGS